jgi:hypothetical protein
LTPVGDYLHRVESALGSKTEGFLRVPTVFWWSASDLFLERVGWAGIVLSLMVLLGYANVFNLSLLWCLYLSIVHVGQDWYQFGWEIQLLEESPMGVPRTWVLECGDEIVGISSAFPRRLRVDGRILNAWVLGDFCVAKEHRSLGPAMALQRAVCESVDRGDVDLWYDFPSRTMSAIHGRMGLKPRGELVRLVYPLRVDRLVEKKVPAGLVASGLREVGNRVLASRDAVRRRDDAIEVDLWDRECEAGVEPGFDASGGVSLERTAAYLNWRYRRDPRGSVTILSARRDGGKPGFVTFRRVEEDHPLPRSHRSHHRRPVMNLVELDQRASKSATLAVRS